MHIGKVAGLRQNHCNEIWRRDNTFETMNECKGYVRHYFSNSNILLRELFGY